MCWPAWRQGGRGNMFKRQTCREGIYGDRSEEEQWAVAQIEEKTTQHTMKIKRQQWTRLVKEQGATEGGGVAATSPYLRQSDGIIIWISASRRIVLAWRWLSAVTSAPCHANRSRLDGDQEIRCHTGACVCGAVKCNPIKLRFSRHNQQLATLVCTGWKMYLQLENVKVMFDEKHFKRTRRDDFF